MADQNQLNDLNRIIVEFEAMNLDDLLRPSLGTLSLKSELGPIFDDIKSKLIIINNHSTKVGNNTISKVRTAVGNIIQRIKNAGNLDEKDFVAQRVNLIETIRSAYENLLDVWPPFVSAVIEELGIMGTDSFTLQLKNAHQSLTSASEAAIKEIKNQSAIIIEEAKQLSVDIEGKARKTATKISVKAAQDQFSNAQTEIKKDVIIWAIASGISLVVFVGTALYFLNNSIPKNWDWHVIYFTTIRITILTAIGTAAAFCLKILKANLHMRAHNKHRQRVANSIEAFVEAAVTPDQRDLILTHLIDAVVNFGNSGLLREEDPLYSPKMTIDTITRNILPSQGKT